MNRGGGGTDNTLLSERENYVCFILRGSVQTQTDGKTLLQQSRHFREKSKNKLCISVFPSCVARSVHSTGSICFICTTPALHSTTARYRVRTRADLDLISWFVGNCVRYKPVSIGSTARSHIKTM